jgi:hypothetical protein
MRRQLTSLLCWLLVLIVLALLAQVLRAAPADAVVRLPSHGASATIIHTEEGRTLLLGCAHAFLGKDRGKPIVIDAPDPSPGAMKRGGTRLLAVDYQADLSLVEMQVGPLPYACLVAPRGHQPGRLLSVGYDEMRWPAIQRPATLLGSDPQHSFTREKPWHGRSGGALIDLDSGYLVGVVSGYREVNERQAPIEVTPQGRGVYVSHDAILRFLQRYSAPAPNAPIAPNPGRPWVSEYQGPRIGPPYPGGLCPMPGK